MDATTTQPAPHSPETKPSITRKEVSWHCVVAAIRARREAEAQGIDPQARTSLAYAASRSEFPPITLGTLWAIDAVEPYLGTLCGRNHWADQAMLSTVILHPERALMAILSEDIPDLQAAILETATTITPDRSAQLERWYGQEMDRLKHIAGGSAVEAPAKK